MHGAKYKHQFTVSTPDSDKGDSRSFMLRAESLEDYQVRLLLALPSVLSSLSPLLPPTHSLNTPHTQSWRTNLSTAIIESSHSMGASPDPASSPKKLSNPMFRGSK